MTYVAVRLLEHISSFDFFMADCAPIIQPNSLIADMASMEEQSFVVLYCSAEVLGDVLTHSLVLHRIVNNC